MNPDIYQFSHLSTHLYHTRRLDDLYRLVNLPSWVESSKNIDSSGGLLAEDIRRTYQGFDEALTDSLENADPTATSQHMTTLAALALQRARIGQSTLTLRPHLLEAYARLGATQKAVQWAKTITDPLQRAESFINIGWGAYETGAINEAGKCWAFARQSLNDSSPNLLGEKYSLMGDLVVFLTRAGLLKEAQTLAIELETGFRDEEERARGVTNTTQFARAEAWAALGRTDLAAGFVDDVRDFDDKLQLLSRAAHTQLLVTGKLDMRLLEIGVKLYQENQNDNMTRWFASMLSVFGKFAESDDVTAKLNSQISQARVWRIAAGICLLLGENERALQYARKIKNFIQSQPHPMEKLNLETSIILGEPRDGSETLFQDMLSEISQEFIQKQEDLDAQVLGDSALTFAALGEYELSEKAIVKGLRLDIQTDDWDQIYLFIWFAEQFAQYRYISGLETLLDYAEKVHDAWPKSELLLAISRAARVSGQMILEKKATSRLKEIVVNDKTITQYPNTLGAYAVWCRSQGFEKGEANKVVRQAIDSLHEHPDGTDSLAYLAMTLAQNRIRDLGCMVLDAAILALSKETDPNTIARAAGTTAQVAGLLNAPDYLERIRGIAEMLEDEWLRAEALFWIAGWQAVLGLAEESLVNFRRALEDGAWLEVNWDSYKEAIMYPEPSRLVEMVEYVGWPSTQVAIVFAFLATFLAEPTKEKLVNASALVNTIPLEYSEKRALCLELLFRKAKAYDMNTSIRLFQQSLMQVTERHMGEVWAVLRTGLPYLKTFLGVSQVLHLWDRIMDVVRVIAIEKV